MTIFNRLRNKIQRLIKKRIPPLYNKFFFFEDAKIYYTQRTGKVLSYRNVYDISEKLMWLHRYWQNPLIVKCADKYAMREYISSMNLEEILVPLLGVYDNVNKIDFDKLPNKFVLKCTHGCGYNIICKDKSQFDKNGAYKMLEKWLSDTYGLESFELHYSQIKPRVICEEYLDFTTPINAIDYKLHCFNGKPFCFLVCSNRDIINNSVDLSSYSLEWDKLDYLNKESSIKVPKPAHIEEMIRIATILSKPFPYVRVDMYYINNQIYIGELTFTPAGNIMNYYKESTLELMGTKLTLPKKYKKKSFRR